VFCDILLASCSMLLFLGSGCRTACGSLNLKPYSTAFCNMTVTHDESAVGLVETKQMLCKR